jgi:cell wall assembly regulator SMI1
MVTLMDKFENLLTKWNQILNKLESNNGLVYPIEIGEKATIQEIQEKEKELGYNLPPSYKSIIQNHARSLSFYYAFSENTMIPDEFSEIFSGEINWDFSELQNLDKLADDLEEDGEDYGKNLRGKLEFSHAGNGDIYAFDMSVKGAEKPVIYWDHEEDTVTYIADSFIDYLEMVTEINCVGSEKWQIEYFLNENGINTSGSKALRWKQWFDAFSETSLDDVKDNLDQLISYIIYRGKLDNAVINSIKLFNKKDLFDKLLNCLHKYESYKDKRMICEIIGEALGHYAKAWVTNLWDENNDELLDARLRSYLSLKCLDANNGVEIVLNYLEKHSEGKINGYDALSHLSSNKSQQVLVWMESHVKFPVTEGWSELFIESNPSWNDIKRWSNLEERHYVTVIHALESMLEDKIAEPDKHYDINLPSKKEFVSLLNDLKSKQMLRTRIQILDELIENVDQFYLV